MELKDLSLLFFIDPSSHPKVIYLIWGHLTKAKGPFQIHKVQGQAEGQTVVQVQLILKKP